MSEPFRTPTGQTGPDAYQYEAAAIANAQRELDNRFHRLIDAVRSENPQMFVGSTDYMFRPSASKAEQFGHYLRGPEHYRFWLANKR
jgi:hypothetical protein